MGFERKVADLVEESVPPSDSANAHAPGMGARERPSLVAKELRFDELAGQGGDVDRDERPRSARSFEMDGAGNELAGPALAGHEHGERMARQTPDLIREPAHHDRSAGHTRERVARRLRLFTRLRGHDHERAAPD